MKNLFIFFFLALTASHVKAAGTGEINSAVEKAFSKNFSGAENVNWSELKDGFRVTFKQDHKLVRAFFNKEGILMRTFRYFDINSLPLTIQLHLIDGYGQCKVFGIIEETINNQTIYHITLESGTSWIKVDADAYGNLVFISEMQKA